MAVYHACHAIYIPGGKQGEITRSKEALSYFTRLALRVMRLLYPAKVFARIVELKRVIALSLRYAISSAVFL